ncbi:MAG: response regulator, partial [Anaerolineales bacterium]|nr:response regulator [Anaerolineales bacterium]
MSPYRDLVQVLSIKVALPLNHIPTLPRAQAIARWFSQAVEAPNASQTLTCKVIVRFAISIFMHNMERGERTRLTGTLWTDYANLAKESRKLRVDNGLPTKVLLIEDDKAMCETLKLVLEPDTFEVYEVNSGSAGVEAARSLKPDVIILDLLMPGMDGWEATRAIRAFSRIP